MAFVVVFHLSPEHESIAAAILQRATRMPVQQVTQPSPIEPDHVYVIAPGLAAARWTMATCICRATASGGIGQPVAVDLFFRTLAQAHRDRAICGRAVGHRQRRRGRPGAT